MLSDVLPFTAFMDVENSRSYIDDLYSSDADKCLNSLICIKNSVIGSNRRKGSVIEQGIVPRLMQLLQDKKSSSLIRQQAAVTVGSLAKGTDGHVLFLINSGIISLLLEVLQENDLPSILIDICLSCLQTLSEKDNGINRTVYSLEQLQRLLHYAECSDSVKRQSCVASILSAVCRTPFEQNTFKSVRTAEVLSRFLANGHYVVIVPSLRCLAAMIYENQTVANYVAYIKSDDLNVVDLFIRLVSRDKPVQIQLEAARCLTNLHRAGVIVAVEEMILYRTLPCLVRLCQVLIEGVTNSTLNMGILLNSKDEIEHEMQYRATAADTLSYLIEVDTNLQQTTAISNQLISALADLLNSSDVKAKQGALRAFASLGANDENIRKRVIETNKLMERVVEGLDDSNEDTRLAAVRCLHSLSRSVQLLRTTFQDHTVWRPLMALFSGSAPTELLSAASSALCNLLLEFSPAKEPILQQGAIHLLANLTRRPESALRLNGVWALMNLAFQSEQRIKSQILTALGTDQIFRLLADSDTRILMKTLGLIRNFVSPRSHTDAMMALHGAQVMQAVIVVLEGPHSPDVKEQALCILANIADGEQAKENIMANEDVLKKLIDYMTHTSSRLQAASVCCISNLVRLEEPGVAERQSRLRDLGVITILHQLVLTPDSLLFDKVKTAISLFTDL